ncbi:hypothetical protein CSB20_03010 [bacterium DOLZORAL124_64_63]|nr:MAG: hypothetical protein CSB20_03010 [bacterium DOLZORAL124_64_63]
MTKNLPATLSLAWLLILFVQSLVLQYTAGSRTPRMARRCSWVIGILALISIVTGLLMIFGPVPGSQVMSSALIIPAILVVLIVDSYKNTLSKAMTVSTDAS